MKLLNKVYDGNLVRYKTDDPELEYTVVELEEKELLDLIPKPRRLISSYTHTTGFSHPVYKPLPVEVSIRYKLQENISTLLNTQLTNPVLEFSVEGIIIDLQVIQSTNILSYSDVYMIFDICSLIADTVKLDAAVIKPILSYKNDEIVLYRLPDII